MKLISWEINTFSNTQYSKNQSQKNKKKKKPKGGKKAKLQNKQKTLLRHQKPQMIKGCTIFSNQDANVTCFQTTIVKGFRSSNLEKASIYQTYNNSAYKQTRVSKFKGGEKLGAGFGGKRGCEKRKKWLGCFVQYESY